MKKPDKKRGQRQQSQHQRRRQTEQFEEERQKRRRTERALAQYWKLLDALLQTTPDLVTLKNPDGRYQAASPTFCRFVGRPEPHVRGFTDADLFPPDVAEIFARYDRKVVESARPHTWEEALTHYDVPYWYRFYKSPILSDDGACAGILATGRDLTAQRCAQEQNKIFARAGEDGFWLHGNILDVNHAYCATTGYRRDELVGKNLFDIEVLTTPEDLSLRNRRIVQGGWDRYKTIHRAKDHRIVEFEVCVNYVDVAGGRFYRFFRELAATRPDDDAPLPAAAVNPATDRYWRVLSVYDIVQQVLTLQRETLPPGIYIDLDLDTALWNTRAHLPQIMQILMNLVTNAVEAIEGRGRIVIATRNIEMDAALARAYPSLTAGKYVLLTVEDNGHGIGEKLLGKVFEPFITTKFKGRGMGLASVARNVKEHGGHVTVRSQEGAGATFSVYLPATDQPTEMAEHTFIIPTGTETILIADPLPEVREEAESMLEALAYTVHTAATTDDVRHRLETDGATLHLLVIDPALIDDPIEFLTHCQIHAPGMRIILATTHGLDHKTQTLLENGAATHLQKPLRIDIFAPKVRAILDA